MLRRKKKKKEQTPPDGAAAATATDGAADGEASAETAPGPEAAVDQADDGARPGDAAIARAEEPPVTAEEPPGTAEEVPTTAEETPPPSPEAEPSGEPARSGFGPPPPPPPEGDYVERLPASFYFEGVVKPERVPSREELERQAEEEFRAAIAPSLSALRELVPDASGPDEAMRVLAERQGEALVDEGAAGLSSRDIYRNEASVYYRIRNHFDKPSRRVGFGGHDWRPPPGLAPRRSELPSGRRRSR